jgi:hypothetical protein
MAIAFLAPAAACVEGEEGAEKDYYSCCCFEIAAVEAGENVGCYL